MVVVQGFGMVTVAFQEDGDVAIQGCTTVMVKRLVGEVKLLSHGDSITLKRRVIVEEPSMSSKGEKFLWEKNSKDLVDGREVATINGGLRR